ncbi:MAG TPA: LysR family transcriptional regulator [Xanthobacteraceae bacterium]|jgi:DNA-binding transcriptional LysR family regulator
MEWDDLKHFLAVARTGSLTRAALTLRVSLATVSRRIAGLERRLGARLFDRKRSGYELTESGDAVRLKAEEIEQAILSVERQMLGRDRHPSGKVRVTTGDDIAAFVIAPTLAAFNARYPGISLEIVARFEVADLARREADIGLRTVAPTKGDFLVRHAGWWNLGLYAARSYAQAHDLAPGAGDLSHVGVITWDAEHANLGGGPWFAKHAPGARVVLAANSRVIQFAACKAGLGVAILPCVAADREPELIRLLPSEQVASTKLWLVVHRDLAHTARVRAVMDFLGDIVPQRDPPDLA